MNETQKLAFPLLERPDEILDGIAAETWQAYNAMETTKRRHFERLEILDNKKKNYNLDPSEKEKVLLASLFKDHDEQVKRFTKLSTDLKSADSKAHRALFVYIGFIGNIDEQVLIKH